MFGCSHRTERDRIPFYRIPAVKCNSSSEIKNLLSKRRYLWIQRINRKDFTEFKANYSRVCSDHFVSGKPCDIKDVNNPDWAPSLKLGYENVNSKALISGNQTSKSVRNRKKVLKQTFAPVALSVFPDHLHESDTMSSCVASNCDTCSKKPEPGVTFHYFPKNEEMRKKWISAVGRKNWQASGQSKLCSRHFTEDQFIKSSTNKVCLKKDAVPCVFPEYSSVSEEVEEASLRCNVESDDDNISETSMSPVPCDITSSPSAKRIKLSQDAPFSAEETSDQPCSPGSSLTYEEENVLNFQPSTVKEFIEPTKNSQDLSVSSISGNITSSISKATSVVSFGNPMSSEEFNSISNETSSLVSKVANVLYSQSAATVAVNALPSDASLQIIQCLISPYTAQRKINYENDSGRQDLKSKIEKALEKKHRYSKKLEIMKQTVNCQTKKIEILDQLTSSIKRERMFKK